MLYNAIYTDSPGFPIASVQGICWRTQTAHSAPVPRIWAHGEEWNKPKFPPDTARTQWGIAANTPKPHYPAGHMQLMQLQDISLSQHPSKDSYSLNIKDKVKMWLLGLGGGSTVLWSTSSTETFLGTATKRFSLYCCYSHCKGSLPFRCDKRIWQIVFPPTGKQEEQEKNCTAEDGPILISRTRVQRGKFWGIHTLYRTPVSSASWFTHGSTSDGSWMSPSKDTD